MATRLTDSDVRKLPAPASGNRIHYDTEVKGFGARVTAGGAKSFVLNYRAQGRERRLTIGSFPNWPTARARDQARQLRRRIDVGGDPMADRDQERTAPTVADMAARYIEEQGPRKRPRGIEEDRSLLGQHIVPKLGRLRVEAVRRQDVEALFREVTKATPIRANRMHALLRRMFNLAIAWDWIAANPCVGIERNPENKRERYLSAEELERLMQALAAHPEQHSANAVRLLLLTGARRGEVLGATWDQFDLTDGVWTKPAALTKQKKLHRIPLSAPARQLLATMRAEADDDAEAVFPGRRGEFQTTLKTFWRAICRSARIEGVTLHDLRHSYASHLASAGLSLHVIGQLLGHSSPATTHRYAHLFDDPLRAATDRVGRIVTEAARAPGSKARAPIPIRRRPAAGDR
jgi:integrase